MQISGSLIPVPSLGLFSFHLIIISNSNEIVLALSYILFCFVLLLSIRNLFFSKGVGVDGEVSRE